MFVPVTCQAALFFSPDFHFKPLATAGIIATKLSSLFSVEPSTVPYPPNIPLPLEVPRIVLQNDPAGQVTVSQARADMVINFHHAADIESKLSDYIGAFSECFESAQIVRLGVIFVFDFNNEDSLSIIKEEYIKSDKLNDSPELYVGWLKKFQLLDIPVNRLVNFNCNKTKSTLIVDTNTVPENSFDLKPDLIRHFSEECLKQYRGDMRAFIER